VSNLSHSVRKTNRFEIKYLTSTNVANHFKQVISTYLIPDEHGNHQGSYQVASLYYDTSDFRFFWEKLDGIKFRRKLRIRRYRSSEPMTPDSPVFVEIKKRYNRVTQKRRALLPYQEALRLCNERRIPPHDPQDTLVIEEVARMVEEYNLKPVSLLSYTRQAWIGTDYEIGLRVTFDTSLEHYPSHLQLDDLSSGLPMIAAHMTIIEIKINDRIPYWLTELVAKHNLKLVRFSKYCRSIELAHNLPIPAWEGGE
jgi:SPX domain protein involved in polyphosphate accumulation